MWKQLPREDVEATRRPAFDILERITDAFASLDAEGRILYANESVTKLLQRPRAEIVGRTIWEVYPVTIGRRFETAFRDAVEKAVESSYEGYHRPSHRWYEMQFTPYEDMVLVCCRDVTERHRAEEARAELAAIVQSCEDAIISTRLDGTIWNWNHGAERLYGYTAEEVKGKPATLLFPKERPDELPAIVARVARGEYIPTHETVRISKKGERVDVALSVSPIRDSGGRVIGASGIARDITALKKAEQTNRRLALERDQLVARLRLQIERMPIGFIVQDANFRFTGWNPAAEQIFGYSELEVLGKTAYETVIADSGRASMEEILERVKGGDMSAHTTAEHKTKDGRSITCEWYNTPIMSGDGVLESVLSMVVDVTERRSLEERLRQSHKMEAVGQLAGGVAHDFNNLLTVIMGGSDMVLARLPAGTPLRELISEIREAGTRAASLTRQLLAFSRKQVLAAQVLDLNSIVTDMEKMLRRTIGEDVDLATCLEHGLYQVKADPVQIQQVLLNLAVNARDAMPRGGKLTIETRNVELDASYARGHSDVQPGCYVMAAVSDTGCGMDAATRARIFEPFFTTKEVGKGTGLGLATVYGIVKQSGGHIEVYSEVGAGTTFKIYLPRLTELPEEPAEIQVMTAAPGGRETIFLVEDEDTVRRLTRHLLEDSGYTVLEARNGREALELWERDRTPIHLLLTDVVMPEVGGRQLAEWLLPMNPQMRVLYVSGYTDDAIVRHGVLEAETNFMQKPYSPLALARKVREVLDAPPVTASQRMRMRDANPSKA
jgi:PAS domain S-box-containing protein